MEHDTNAQPAQQLPLFDEGETLTEVAVSALTTEPELRDIGRALITLTRYHANKTPAEVAP
jgi:hypothetical protein